MFERVWMGLRMMKNHPAVSWMLSHNHRSLKTCLRNILLCNFLKGHLHKGIFWRGIFTKEFSEGTSSLSNLLKVQYKGLKNGICWGVSTSNRPYTINELMQMYLCTNGTKRIFLGKSGEKKTTENTYPLNYKH